MDAQDPSTSLDNEKQKTEAYPTFSRTCRSHLKKILSKEEFIREYRQLCDAEWKEKAFYLLLLSELEAAILTGELNTIKKVDTGIAYINDIENESKLKDFYNSTDNAIRNTNVVILTCKHKRVGILKHILSSEIINNLSINIGRNAIAFNDEDEACHNAFYYSVRSNNVELLDTLINQWPNGYSAAHSLELDETLSNVYEKLRLKNVPLSDEMHIYVEKKLIELRFFSDDSVQSQVVNDNFGNIIERISLVIEHVSLLVVDYSEEKRIDERFLFLMKCITKCIHVLKEKMKSSYNWIPWEEMEFCLISFISSYVEKQEINFFYRITLNKRKIFRYLEDFVKVLENEKDSMLFTDLLKEERELITSRIINIHSQFEELYADHRQIRDAYSLYRMNDYIELALSVDTEQREGQLTILRALQVIGDCLKNTLESPKLSHCASKLVLLSLPENTRKVQFFVDVQNDMKAISATIKGMLHTKRIKFMNMLLEKTINSESLEELREAADAFNTMNLNLITQDFVNLELDDLELLVKQLYNTITYKTQYEEMLLHQILRVIEVSKNTRESKTMDYWKPCYLLKCINLLSNNNKIDMSTVKYMKNYAKEALKYIKFPADSRSLKEIAEKSQLILFSIQMRLRNDDSDIELQNIVYQISYFTECGAGTSERIERLWAKLNRGTINGTPLLKSKKSYDDLLDRKLSELKYILTDNGLISNLLKNMFVYKNNKKLQSAIEMLVLDILDIADDYLEDNLFFWDDSSPMLTGKYLRDHLAHDNTLVNVLLSDPSTMVLLNATKLVSGDMVKNIKKLGRRMKDNYFKIRDKNDQSLTIIAVQKKMFAAFEEGRVDDVKSYILAGADVYGRNSDLWTVIHFAAKGSSIKIVELILDCGSNIHVKDVDGRSPLHIAAANGSTEIVTFFIEILGYDVNAVDNSRRTPLHVAVENHRRDTVEILLSNNARADMQDISANVPLHYAVRHNCIDIVKILMKNVVDIDINQKFALEFTLLHIAAEWGHNELVTFFIENNADVGATSDIDITPLHLATMNGHLEVVKTLISNGADVNSRVIDGCTSLHYAVENGHEAVAAFLLTHGADPNIADEALNSTALHCAAKHGHANIVLDLLINGADANITSSTKMTPLHFAAEGGHLEVVNILIGHNAKVNAENSVGYTPLYYAAGKGYKEIVELLIEKEADINVKNSRLAPLHAAAESKQEEVVDCLIQNKAEVNLKAEDDMTPLHVAASSPSNENIIRLLRDNEAEVDSKNSYGMTPLHMAALAGCVVNASLLIEYNADVNAVNKDDQTPLHLAVLNGHKEIVTLLIRHNANMNIKGNVMTPLNIAVFSGHKEIVEMLFRNRAIIDNRESSPMLLSAVKFNNKEIVELLMANGISKLLSEGNKILAMAITAGYIEIIEMFLRHGVPVDERYPDQSTILHVAAETGSIRTVDALISKGADINAACTSNITPLHVAAREGHDKVVESLVKNGATINVKSLGKNSPLHLAVEMGHCNIVKILVDNGATIDDKDGKNRTPLEMAVTHDHLDVVKTLLEYKKLDLNADCNESKLLHLAAQKSNLKMVKFLVDEGADVHGKNSSQSKAIHVARNKDIIEYFLSKGLSVNELDVHDKTPLHYAVQEGLLEVVKYLIDQDADVNAKSDEGATPLHMAAVAKFKDIVEFLLKNGAMYDCADKSNKLPSESTDDEHIVELLTVIKKLFEAVKRNDANSTRKIIKARAFVNVRDSNNVTPLYYATREGNDTIAYDLLEYGATPDTMSDGQTLLHYAAKSSYLKVVTVLLMKGATYNILSIDGKTPLDLATDNNVKHLLTLINKSFRKVKKNDTSIILELRQIKHIETIKAVMNARNEKGETLVVAAIHNNFSNVEMLKEMSQGNISNQINDGIVLLQNREYEAALNTFKNAYHKRMNIFGPDNPATLDVQLHVAQALYQQGSFQEALTMYEEIFQKLNETLGSHDKSTLNTRSMIALTFYRLGRHIEALNIYRDLYQKQEEALGPNNENTMNTQFQIGIALAKLERCDEALGTYAALFEKRKNECGVNHPDTLKVQNSIAMILNQQGKCDEALKVHKDVLKKKKAIYRTHHIDILPTLRSIAAIFFQQNRYREALNTYQELLSLQEAILVTDHPDTLSTHYCMISIFLKQGKRLAALKACAKVLPRMKAILAPSHAILQDTIKMMNAINFTLKVESTDITTVMNLMHEKINNAAAIGDVGVIESMFTEGLDLNDSDMEGKTPLYHAASEGQMRVVQFLLDNDASVNVSCVEGKTPLYAATINGHKNIVELLLQHISRDKLGNFVNVRTVTGATPLHIAAQNGFLDIVCCLLSHGAIHNLEDDEGRTPCNLSKTKSAINLLRLIEELFENAKKGNTNVVSKLSLLKESNPEEFAAVTNARNIQMNTILQVAISNRHKEIASELLKILK